MDREYEVDVKGSRVATGEYTFKFKKRNVASS